LRTGRRGRAPEVYEHKLADNKKARQPPESEMIRTELVQASQRIRELEYIIKKADAILDGRSCEDECD
jgi:hypothetical protein